MGGGKKVPRCNNARIPSRGKSSLFCGETGLEKKKNSQQARGGCSDGRNGICFLYTQFLESRKMLHQKWLLLGMRPLFQQSSVNINLRTSSTPMNSVYFFQQLPSRTLSKTGAQCKGGKHSKLRLTGMAAANALGEKLPMFVIGKSKNPRCFKNVKKVPCRYRAQKKS